MFAPVVQLWARELSAHRVELGLDEGQALLASVTAAMDILVTISR